MSDSGHELFDRVVGQYARTRPGYPEESLDWLAARAGLTSGSRVLDLGAGTGKLTVALAARGYEVVAVEPLPGMRAQLEHDMPEVSASSQEAPSRSRSPTARCDAVCVAQAFHWFEPHAALSEIARVLAPDGSFVLVWNLWDIEDPAQAALDRIVSPLETGRIRHLTTANHPYGAWPGLLAADERFGAGAAGAVRTHRRARRRRGRRACRVDEPGTVGAAGRSRRRRSRRHARSSAGCPASERTFRYTTEVEIRRRR